MGERVGGWACRGNGDGYGEGCGEGCGVWVAISGRGADGDACIDEDRRPFCGIIGLPRSCCPCPLGRVPTEVVAGGAYAVGSGDEIGARDAVISSDPWRLDNLDDERWECGAETAIFSTVYFNDLCISNIYNAGWKHRTRPRNALINTLPAVSGKDSSPRAVHINVESGRVSGENASECTGTDDRVLPSSVAGECGNFAMSLDTLVLSGVVASLWWFSLVPRRSGTRSGYSPYPITDAFTPDMPTDTASVAVGAKLQIGRAHV